MNNEMLLYELVLSKLGPELSRDMERDIESQILVKIIYVYFVSIYRWQSLNAHFTQNLIFRRQHK